MWTSGVQTSTARIVICGAYVFHISQLKKCLRIPNQTIDVVDVTLEPDLTYSEHHIRVLDQKDKITRKRTLKFYKVQWNQHTYLGGLKTS
jgi:hypothetical protein